MSEGMPYRITNSTPYAASGSIKYKGCPTDSWTASQLPAGGSWSHSHGVCLITEISATVNGIAASPYTSSGTSYSQFAIIVQHDGGFAVTRVVS